MDLISTSRYDRVVLLVSPLLIVVQFALYRFMLRVWAPPLTREAVVVWCGKGAERLDALGRARFARNASHAALSVVIWSIFGAAALVASRGYADLDPARVLGDRGAMLAAGDVEHLRLQEVASLLGALFGAVMVFYTFYWALRWDTDPTMLVHHAVFVRVNGLELPTPLCGTPITQSPVPQRLTDRNARPPTPAVPRDLGARAALSAAAERPRGDGDGGLVACAEHAEHRAPDRRAWLSRRAVRLLRRLLRPLHGAAHRPLRRSRGAHCRPAAPCGLLVPAARARTRARSRGDALDGRLGAAALLGRPDRAEARAHAAEAGAARSGSCGRSDTREGRIGSG